MLIWWDVRADLRLLMECLGISRTGPRTWLDMMIVTLLLSCARVRVGRQTCVSDIRAEALRRLWAAGAALQASTLYQAYSRTNPWGRLYLGLV